MHIAAALDLHWSRRGNPRRTAGGQQQQPPAAASLPAAPSQRPSSEPPRRRGRAPGSLLCPPLGFPSELCGGKVHVWGALGLLVAFAVLCIGTFEATRLTTHVLRSPCTVLGSEVIDVGTCTLCDYGSPTECEVHPIATARLAVTFKPLHSEENVTGYVWYCKGRAATDPCQRQSRFLDQLSLDASRYEMSVAPAGPVPCTVGEVFAYMQLHAAEGEEHQCYYSSRDPDGEDVWLTMPSPGLVDHAWFQKHVGYPVFLALGGLVLLSVLLGCLALEGAELWASGLVPRWSRLPLV